MDHFRRHLSVWLIGVFLVGAAQAQHWSMLAQDDVPVFKRWATYEQLTPMQQTFARSQHATFKTDGAYRPVEVMTQLWDGIFWTDALRIKARYDGNLLIEESMEVRIPGTGWVDFVRNTTTYNAEHRPIEVRTEGWNPSSGWEKVSRTMSEYDADGYLVERVFQEWSASQWVFQTRTLYTSTGGLLEATLTQEWNGSAWDDKARETCTYPGRTMVIITEHWNGTAWEHAERTTMFNIYYGDFSELLWPIIDLLRESWNGTTWVNEAWITTLFSADGLPEHTLTQNWDGTTWVDAFKESYRHNTDGNLSVLVGVSSDGVDWIPEVRMLITWSPVAQPSAVDDATTTDEDTAVTFDVLANDSNPEGGTLSITAFSQPAHGTVKQISTTELTYTPKADFHGEDTFTYTAGNDLGGTADATVVVTVNPVNDAPVFTSTPDAGIAIGTVYDYTVEVTDVDGDAVRITASTLPAWLTLTDNDDGTATLSGTPTNADAGEHGVILEVSDSSLTTSQAFTITVVNNTPPSASQITNPAAGDQIIVGSASGEDPLPPDTPFTVTWTEATDPNGDAVTYTWQLATAEDFVDGTVLASVDVGTATMFETTLGTVAGWLDGTGVTPGSSVALWHRVVTTDGLSNTPGTAAQVILVRGTLVSAEDEAEVPTQFELFQNYPNPFNPTTTIAYKLSQTSDVRLVVYDLFGREVATLVQTRQPAGRYTVPFKTEELASGTYFYRIEAGSYVATQRMMLVK